MRKSCDKRKNDENSAVKSVQFDAIHLTTIMPEVRLPSVCGADAAIDLIITAAVRAVLGIAQ